MSNGGLRASDLPAHQVRVGLPYEQIRLPQEADRHRGAAHQVRLQL